METMAVQFEHDINALLAEGGLIGRLIGDCANRYLMIIFSPECKTYGGQVWRPCHGKTKLCIKIQALVDLHWIGLAYAVHI